MAQPTTNDAAIEAATMKDWWWKPVFSGRDDWEAHELLWKSVRFALVEGCGDRWFGNLGNGYTLEDPSTQLCRHVGNREDAKRFSEEAVLKLLTAALPHLSATAAGLSGDERKIVEHLKGFRKGLEGQHTGIDTLLAIIDRLAASPAASGVRWRHKKRGTIYTEVGRGKLQSSDTGGMSDMDTMVVYRGGDGQLWVRPDYEFDDGRFEPAAPPASRRGEPAPEGERRGYYGCKRPPGACHCPQDKRHACTFAHWIAEDTP